MRISLVALVSALAFLASPTVDAQEAVTAKIQAQCTGARAGAQVAMRWGHPTHASNEYMPLFTVPCGVGMREATLTVVNRASDFEVQTEGGPETAYVIKVAIRRGAKLVGQVDLNHAGSLSLATRGNGFSLARSSGPNKYGEQNFRVAIPNGANANVRIRAEVPGDSDNSQLALRWGHSDFHDNEYFPIWTVKKGAAQEKVFRLSHPASEFEIQTEGGESTKYHLSIWLDLGQGVGMQPSIEINHALKGTGFSTASSDGVAFSASRGNAFGEMNVGVTVPWLPEEVEKTGPGGLTLRYIYGRSQGPTATSSPITIRYLGGFIPGSSQSAEGRTAFQTDHGELIGPVGENIYTDSEKGLRAGDWNVQVGLFSNGNLFDVISCSVKIAAAGAGLVTINRPTRSCS